MAVIEGVKSIPACREVKIVTGLTAVITIAACRNPRLKRRDPVLALGGELAQGRATFHTSTATAPGRP
jgi:hypothetical protein